MANIKISALPAASSVALTDEFEVNQGGTSRKATASQIVASAFVNTVPAGGLGFYSPSADTIRTPNSLIVDDDLTVTGGDLTFGSGQNAILLISTSNGADNRAMFLCSGGAIDSDRGAMINMFGNEHAGTGKMQIYAGNVAGGVIESYTGGALRSTLDASGNFGIGTLPTTGKLVVDQTSTTAAIPTLVLEQRDVSEQMMMLDTTIGTGNAIEAVAAKVLTTTHFVKVNVVGVGDRYFPVGTIA